MSFDGEPNNIEAFPQKDEETLLREEKVTNCTTIEELYQVLSEIREIPTSQGAVAADTLIASIDNVLQGGSGIYALTDTYGIRTRVASLFNKHREPTHYDLRPPTGDGTKNN